MSPTRRQVLQSGAALVATGLAGCGRSGLPGEQPDAVTPNPSPGAMFSHGVASGDPLADRVILWTRVAPADGDADVPISWVVATDPALQTVVRTSTDGVDITPQTARAIRDYTYKVDVTGLAPGTSYYYQFRAGDQTSPVGRTRTAPVTSQRLRFAVASCAKYHQAYWHAYRDIAARADLDLVIHCGDYIYEETEKGSAIPGRNLDDNIEIYTLAEYRARHAFYKTDPDLRQAHRQHPFATIWDDHEIADNCWYGGAHRHFEDAHGPWADRRAAAVRAYDEWMPIRTQPTPAGKNDFERIYRALDYGDLAEIVLIDARLIGRDQETPGLASDSQQPANPVVVNDPDRTILGAEQREWLLGTLSASTAQWKVIANPHLIAQLHAAPGLRAAGGGQVINTDQWDGYRADQNRVLDHLRAGGIDNTVFVTGDIHSSWANDVTDDPHNPLAYVPDIAGSVPPAAVRALAVEFVTPGVGSDAGAIGDIAPLAPQVNPHVRFIEAQHRGYFVLDLDTERAQAEWTYVDAPEQPESGTTAGPAWLSRSGINHLEEGTGHSVPPADPPPLAP